MRKALMIIIIVLGFIALIKAIKPSEEMRVRVIPNSNSKVDLEIKEEVKEITITYLEKQYDKSMTKFIQNINSSINELNDMVESYNAKGELVNHQFYLKEYNGNAIKDEEVLTFLVKIDNAVGDNWWCVLFPPLCLMDEEEEQMEDVEYKSFIKEIIDKNYTTGEENV